jgi:protein-L-isoaspartate(D-aspartate) O-methyltransferase
MARTTCRPHGTIGALALLIWCTAPASSQRAADPFEAERLRMVDQQLHARDIHDPRVLDAMRRVPRHLFVPDNVRPEAYRDYPVPIGYGQTISQPYIVAFMTEALELEPSHSVLEIGTGSGYQAAILAELSRSVYTIEIVEPLALRAKKTLASLGYRNVAVRLGNGYLGWPEHAPYDRIIVTAAPEEIPPALVEQLKVGGLMAIPVGGLFQQLRVVRRTAAGLEVIKTVPVRFVPMTGKPK